MARSQEHRSILFEYLAPHVGEDTAEALMAEFPTRDGELVTKAFLRAELAELRSEIAGLRSDLLQKQTGLLLGAMAVTTTIIVAFG